MTSRSKAHAWGLTINNLNKFVVRHFEDQALSGLKPNSDKTVTNPSLKAGVSGYTPSLGFSPDGTTTRSCSCYLLSIPKEESINKGSNFAQI